MSERAKADLYAEKVLRAIDRKGPNWTNSDMELLGLYRAISRLNEARRERRPDDCGYTPAERAAQEQADAVAGPNCVTALTGQPPTEEEAGG